MEEDKLPNLTGKIKTDENGREYIDNPNSPNGREYVYSSGVTNWDIYRKAAQENQTPQSWLQGSPIQYNVADGYDTNMSYESLINPELREDYFAKQQSLLGLIGKGAVRGVSAITAGTLESLGYLVNPNTYRALFGEEIVGDFENQFSKTFRELKESMNDLTDPIYRTMQSKSDSLWEAMFDATFWAGNAESIATTLSLMIPGIAAAKGFSTIGKGLGKLGMKLGATAKGAANTARITANVGAGLTSRIMESGMEAKEAYDSFIEAHKLDDKYVNDEAQLRLDAGKAASITMQANMPLFLIDAFQFDSILSGFASFKNANSRLKRIANSLSDYGMNAVSEGLEEGIQYVIQKEAEFSALSDPELKKMLGESFSERWDKYTDDIEFKTSILLGAAGGGLFRAAGPTLNKIYTKALDRLNKYRTAKEIATVQKNPDAFKILSQHEFEEQLGKHVKADSLDQLIQMYEDRVGTLEGEDQVTANNYLETLKAIKPTIDNLQKYPAFRKNKKAATLYALVEQEGIKQQALDQTLNNELNTAVQSIIEGKEDASSIVFALRNRAAQEVLKNIDIINRVKDLGESNFKNHYKKHIADNKQLILQKNDLSNIIARNPKLEDIAYNLEKNFAERMISIDLLTEMQNLKTESEETTKEKSSPKSKEKVSEQTTKTSEEKTEEKVNKKKPKSSESPEQDVDSKASNDEGLDYSDTESGNISETTEFDIDDSITATMNEELFGPIQQDSNDTITDKSRSKDEVVNDIVESINSASNLNDYLAAREEAKKSAETSALSKEAFNKIYKSEDDLLRDFNLDNPTESQANAFAARFFDITEEPVAAELIKEALMNKTPINDQLLGGEEFVAYNEVLDYIKGLQESKQYGDVTPSQDIPDNIPVQEDNSQQSDNVETEYNQNDPLRLVSFKYSYDKYTDSQGNQRIKTIPQNRMDSIKYNSYISFDETIKPEVANVGAKIFFGIPEEFLQYQHSADDADILIYDENNNGISWLRREKKAREWKATDQEIQMLKQQRALLYNKAVSYQGEPILINGKRVIPCNVSSFITSKSYGIITHDGDNYYPIKEALQVDNVNDIKLGIVVGKETNGYTFNIPGVDMNNFHTPPADNFRTGHLFAMVQSANGDYFPLRLYTQKYNTLQQGSALHNYYRTNINNAFKKILDSDPEVSSKGSYELSKYVVIRLVKNNSADLPFMVQKYNGSEYEDVEAVSREEAINRVKESLINIPYNLLNKSGNKIMNELLNSDALQMNIFPGEPFHSPTFGYDRNLVDLNPVKETISEVKEPTKEVKIEEPKPKEKTTDPVEQSFEQTLTVDAIKELPNSPKKRGPLSGPNNKLANKLKGKNFIKPDLSRREEWGKDNDKYSLSNLTKEEAYILERAPKNSYGNLLAPNGSPSNLTIKQYAQVRTKAFKEWFGDWENDTDNASKVVDENGEPLIVYRAGEINEDGTLRTSYEAYYFTPSKRYAEQYAEQENVSIHSFFLKANSVNNIVNGASPIIRSDGKKVAKRGLFEMPWSKEDVNIILEGKEAAYSNGEYLIPNSNQIKSATDNTGIFSKENDDIRYSLVDSQSRQLWNKEKELSWLKENLPQLEENDLIKIHKGLINIGNLYAWGRFKDGVITLSDIAASGTTYHEAFHAVFNMFLTEAETNKLLEKARKEFGLTGKSDIAVEETLADKFRDYVETDQITNKSILDKISDFFKNIYYLIRNKLHLNPSIEQVFYDINRGRYSKKKFEKNRPLVERNWLSNITPSVYKRRVDMLVDTFEDIIDNLAQESPELSRVDVIKQYSLEDYILTIHDQLYASAHGDNAIYTDPTQIDAIDLITDELVQFDADGNPQFGQLALDMLKEISALEGITFKAQQIVDMDMNQQDENTEFMNNEEVVKQEGWQIDQMLISPVTKLRQSTRNIIRRIPKMTSDGTLVSPDDLGYQPYMSGTEVFATMLNKLSTMNKPSDLMKTLEFLSQSFPWVDSIIDILKSDPKLQVDFYNSFRNDSVEYMIISSQSDGTMRVFGGNSVNKAGELLRIWSSNYSLASHNKEELVKSLKENSDKIYKIYQEVSGNPFRLHKVRLWKKNWKSGKFSNPQINAWAREVSSMLNTIGIDSKPSELVKVFQSNMKLNDEKSNFQPMQDFLLNSFRVLRAFHDTINKDDYDIKRNTYYDLELLPVNVRIKALSKALSNVRPSLYESSLREDGKTYSTNITPSFIGKLFKRLTDVEDKSAFEPFKKSFFYTNNEGKFTHPWLKELYNIKTKDLASEIQVSMFLEKDKTRYSELSKPDFLGSKINLWFNNGARDYGYFMLPIPSDASSMPVIRFVKSYDLSYSVDGLVELAKAEIRRIEVYNKRKTLIKQGKLYSIKNFDVTINDQGKEKDGRGSKFLMFPFLNKYNLDELKTSEATLRKYIEEAMEEGFKKFKSNPDLDGTKYDKRITESKLKEFYYNDTLAQYSIMTMTSGDLAYYKNDVDFFKRNKQNMSPGQYGDWETLGIPEKFKAIRMKDNEIPSLVADAYYENLKLNGVSTTEAMIIASKFGYSNYTDSEGNKKVKLPNGQIIDSGLNNATDGQTFITLDRYRNIARMNSKWDDAKESSYQRLKNGTYNVEDILTFSLQPIKPYMFAPHITDSGVDINGKNTSLYQPLQNKNSEAVLIPQMVQNNSLLSALVKGMEDNGIDAVYFESAVKEGIELNTSQELKDKLRKQGKPILPDTLLHFNGDPRELSEANVKYYYLSNDDYMYQMDTPEHFRNTLQLFGSQIRKHIIANLDEDAEFYIEDMKFTGKNIASLFDDILAWNYDKNYKKVIDKIGTIDGLAKELQGGVMQRKFAENTTEAVQLMNYKGEKVFKLPLYFPLQSNRIFQMISSIFRNNIIRNKVSGGALYQASSYGFDNSLKVHMKDGHIEYVDCIMPYTYSNQLAQLADENGMIDPSKVEDKELLKVICYRIPTEDKYSAVPLRIKGFSSPAEGGIIKLPSDILTITGSDLDIDKMYFLSYAAKYTPAKYNLSKIRTWMVNNGLLSDIFSSGNYQEEMNYLSDLLEKYDSGEKLSTEESEAMNEVSKFLKEHPDLVFQKSKLEKIKYNYKQSPEKQSVEASNNALIDIMYSILTSRDAFKTMISGANTSMFADVISTLEKIEKKKSGGDRLFDPGFLTDTYYEYMAGKALTGVFAANSANHSMLQFYNVNLNKKSAITLDGRTVTRISPVKTLDGTNNVTNILGSFLATVVDNAKTLTASKVNLNMFTASTYTLLLRMGFDPKTVMYFMSQPSLRLLSDKVMAKGDMFNYRDSIEEVIKAFSKHTNEQSRFDLIKSGFTQFKQSDLIKAIENYSKSGGDIDLYENAKQILILEAFKDLIEPANTLRSINSAMRSETYGAAPNPGDTIANLAKAKKLSKKTIVSGLGDILTYVSRGEEYEKLMHDPNIKKSLISANTNGVVEYDNFISKYTPFNTRIFTAYRSLLSEAIHDDLTGSEIDELNTIMLNHLTESLDFFKFTKEQKNAWIYKFPVKFLEIVNKDNYLKNINEFTRRLTVQNEFQTTLNGRQSISIIKFSGSRFDNEVAKDEAIRAFEYLWRTPKYTKLAEDLLKYNFVISGWGVTPNSFNHVVPISMINNIPGFNELFRETIFDDNIRVNIDNLIDSYIVNNFRNNRIVPEISKGDNYKFTDKDHSGLTLSHSSSINIKEGSYIKTPYRYIKFNNNGKIELYKLIGATKESAEYQRVSGYGTSTIFEFIEGESSFTSNHLSEKLMKSSELNANLKRHEAQAEIDLVKAMIEGETNNQNNEELDSELSDKLASVSKEAEQIKNHCKGK